MGPPPTGFAGQYLGALAMSHYVPVVFAFQLVAGILLLVNRYVPVGVDDFSGYHREHFAVPPLHGTRWPTACGLCGHSLDRLGVECAVGLCRPARKPRHITEC